MKHVMWLMILFIPVLSFAQEIAKADSYHNFKSFTKSKALRIGDQIPDLQFQNVLNYKSKKVKLSDFKGKLIILDFWSTSCAYCIGAFPKMEKLQNEFKDAIQILLVNPHTSSYDSEEKINAVLTKLKTRTGFYPSLPIPIHDSILNSYFPHQSVPHHVWINGSGEIVAIAGAEYATKENIESILNGKSIDIPLKNDWSFDINLPLLVDGNGGNSDDFTYRALITGYKEGIGFKSGTRTNEKKEIIGAFILNKSLRSLVSVAYPEISFFADSRIIFEVENPSRFRQSSTINTANTYCYDLIIPPAKPGAFNLSGYLKIDLKRYFNISAIQEKRRIKCLVVSVNEKISNCFSKKEQGSDLDKATQKKYIHNYSIAQVLKIFEGCFNSPLIDETGISNKNIDLDFPANFDFSDSKCVKQFLEKNGFSLKEEENSIDVFVVSDNK